MRLISPRLAPFVLAAIASFGAFSPTIQAAAEPGYSDKLTASDRPGWINLVGGPGIKDYAGSPALWLPNVVTYHALGATLTKSFSVSWDIATDKYQTTDYVGLFDGNLGHGYVVFWDSSTEKDNNGQGLIAIGKVNMPAAGATWNDYSIYFNKANSVLGSAPSGTDPGPHLIAAGKRPQTTVKLTWDAATQKLTASVNGKDLVTATDPDFKSFSNVVIFGNMNGWANNLVVEGVK